MGMKHILIIALFIYLAVVFFSGKQILEKLTLYKKIEHIDRYYGPESFITVDNNCKGQQYNLTYGELTSEGMKNIVQFLDNNNYPKKTFIDLGHGSGRALAYAIGYGFENAKGIEIVEQRYNYSIKTINKLGEQFTDYIDLKKGDLFKLKPSDFPPNSVIFVSNLMYPEDTNQKLIKFLNDNTSADVIIIVSKVANNLYNFKIMEELETPMTWANNSKTYILSKNNI